MESLLNEANRGELKSDREVIEGQLRSDKDNVRDMCHLHNVISQFHLKCQNQSQVNSTVFADKIDFIRALKDLFTWTSPCSHPFINLLKKYEKCGETSTEFRERGNEAYHARNFSEALRQYNLAIMFGPSKGESLALAYGNRAALLLEMGHPDLSVQDIDRALECQCPEGFKIKLDARRTRATNNSVLRFSNKMKSADVNPTRGQGYRLEKPNPKISKAESFVSIDWKSECGRRLVVTEAVPCGKLLLMEKPFAASMDKELGFDTQHCHFCLTQIISGFPCPHCPFVLYCSVSCLDEAASRSHRLEEPILAYIYSQEMEERELLILRIICTIGPQGLWDLFKSDLGETTTLVQNSPNASPQQISGVDPKSGIYESGYYQITHLANHSRVPCVLNPAAQSNLDLISRSFVLLNLLQDAGFFSSMTSDLTELNLFREFVTLQIVTLYEVAPFNVMAFSELKSSDSNEHALVSEPLGTGLFPTLSLLNHSCTPNAVHVRVGPRAQTAVISLRPLSAGEELTITYGPRFTTQKRRERQAELQRKYNFLCGCRACCENWPTSDSNLAGVKCPLCSNLVETLTCATCRNVEEWIQKLRGILNKMNQRPNAEIDEEMLSDLARAIEFFYVNFPFPFQYTEITQELFKKALVMQFL